MIANKNNFKLNTLNTLRAIAFVGVSLFHRFGYIAPGGYLAVIIFLALSGFLSMRSADSKEIGLKEDVVKFLKKFIAIMTPVYFILAISLLISFFFAREIFDDSIKSALPVALNFENITRIVNNDDYFNQLGNFNIFTHMWYVSLYMQYVLIFALINQIIQNFSTKVKLLVYGMLTLISFYLMYTLSNTSTISRIYYGVDTRFHAFSLGIIFFLFNETNPYSKIDRRFDKIWCMVLLLLTIIPFFIVDGKDIKSYQIALISYSILVALLIYNLYNYELAYRRDNNPNPIMAYIGSRSYELYLWQYVIQVFSTYFLNNIENNYLVILIEIGAIFILAELTYRILSRENLTIVMFGISALVIIGLYITSLFVGNAKEAEIEDLRTEITATQDEIKKRNEEVLKQNIEPDPVEDEESHETETETVVVEKDTNYEIETAEDQDFIIPDTKVVEENFIEKAYDDFNFTEAELAYLSNLKVVSVGDSVIINADKYIRNFIPNYFLDGEVGRDMVSGPQVLQSLIASVGEADLYVISLGSNGSANKNDLDAIMNIANGKDVYFVNTSHTQTYMDFVNENLRAYTDNNPKAHLVDWRGYIKDRPDYLAVDRTHPNVEGSDAFAKLIMRKILNVNKVAS